MAGYSGNSTAIGIDLGTTNSCVGVFRNGKVEIIADEIGNRIIPSMVSFTNTERFTGASAKSNAGEYPTNTIYGVKRFIGQKYKDKLLQKEMEMVPFRVVSEWSKLKIAVAYKKKEKKFTPQQISAMILSKLKEMAEAFLEHKVTEAVITVPAYFNDSQRKATMDAAKIAGLTVLLLLSEPTAAAIAYGMDKRIKDARNILVYDFGGGTFDVSIMTIQDGLFKVRAVAGDAHLGGEAINKRLLEHLIIDIKRKHKKDILVNEKSLSRLKVACENAKLQLSLQVNTSIEIDNLMDGINYSKTITRARFEELNADLFMNTLKAVQEALHHAVMTKSDIQNVVLVGGSTRIPKVQSLLSEFFGGKGLCKGINLEEAVAYGAAVQAAVLKGDGTCDAIKNIRINDVTPFSLGIEMSNGSTYILIKRNTAIPTKQRRTFLSDAGENEFNINIFQGEPEISEDNSIIGNFALKGLPSTKNGVNVDVTFEIDVNGALTVCAAAKEFGLERKITIIDNQVQLSDEDVTQMTQKEHKYQAVAEKQWKCEQSKRGLNEYIRNIKTNVSHDLNNTIGTADQKKVLELCNRISTWIDDDDEHREVKDYQAKEAELKQLCIPILRKLER